MSILAIDPGNTQSGYVIIGSWPENLTVQRGGVVSNEIIRAVINEHLSSGPGFRYVAIEQIRNMGMIVGQEVFDTVFWTGRFYEQCVDGWNVRPQMVPRNAVKLHLCGSPRAKDANIRQAIINRMGAPGSKKNKGPTYGITSHAWSALAVALFALDNPEET